MEQTPKIEELKAIPQKSKWKLYSLLILVLILVISIAAAVIITKKSWSRYQEADKVIYVFERVEKEKERCQSYIAQPGGEFAEYEYCKKFLEVFE